MDDFRCFECDSHYCLGRCGFLTIPADQRVYINGWGWETRDNAAKIEAARKDQGMSGRVQWPVSRLDTGLGIWREGTCNIAEWKKEWEVGSNA